MLVAPLEQNTLRVPGSTGSQKVELELVSEPIFVPAWIVIVPGASGALVIVTLEGRAIVCVRMYVSAPFEPRSKYTVQPPEAIPMAPCNANVESAPVGVIVWSLHAATRPGKAKMTKKANNKRFTHLLRYISPSY